VQLLLDRGACRQQLNKNRQTPLQTARDYERDAMQELFARPTIHDDSRHRYLGLNSNLE